MVAFWFWFVVMHTSNSSVLFISKHRFHNFYDTAVHINKVNTHHTYYMIHWYNVFSMVWNLFYCKLIPGQNDQVGTIIASQLVINLEMHLTVLNTKNTTQHHLTLHKPT